MSRNSAEKMFLATSDDYQRDLVKQIRSFSHGHHLHTVFSDFVELSALAISNCVDRRQFDAREKRYLEIVGGYEKEEVRHFPKMLATLTSSFEHRVEQMHKTLGRGYGTSGLSDVLGETYMMLDLGNARAGQFFTPYEVSKLMASMVICVTVDQARMHGFVRVHEPACGAGGMIIATAEAFHEAGLNYQQAMHVTCIDIDPCCVHMAYVQLSLLHIPAIVVHGNALSMKVWGQWFTPAHVLGGWNHRLSSRRATEAMCEIISGAPENDIETGHQQEQAPVEDVANMTALFEEARSVKPHTKDVFDLVDQLSLF